MSDQAYFDDIAASRDLYTTLNKLRPSSLNPWLDTADESSVSAIYANRKDIASKPIKIADNTLCCASPWHAALWLIDLQTKMFREGKRILFRGQRDSTWNIEPSISRVTPEGYVSLVAKPLVLLSKTVKALTEIYLTSVPNPMNLGLPIGTYGIEAIGQHYGIPSQLIDFTTDPSVAIYFACHKTNPETDNTASVFCIYYEAALQNGLEVILPPPYAERIYLQRGLFIRSTKSLNRESLSIMEVKFPTRLHFPNHKLEPFVVVRREDENVDILADNTGLLDFITVVQHDTALDKEDFVQAWAMKLSDKLRVRYPHSFIMHVTYLENFIDILESLALVIARDKHWLDESRTKHLVFNNKTEATEMAKVALLVAGFGLQSDPSRMDDWARIWTIAHKLKEILGIDTLDNVSNSRNIS